MDVDDRDPAASTSAADAPTGGGLGFERESPEVEIHGLDRPKMVDWNELQQEMMRLWSLTLELDKVRQEKEVLAKRLDSFIEARRESLKWSNELEYMKQKLELRKLAFGDISMHTKRDSVYVNSRCDPLLLECRSLCVATKTISAAQNQLQDANILLAGKGGCGNLKNLQTFLKARQQYMVAQVGMLYPVKPSSEHGFGEMSDLHSDGSKLPGEAAVSTAHRSPLTIFGLQLTVLPLKKLGFFGDKKEAQQSASVLGYVAHAVSLLASYLDVPLRYPLRLAGSRSYVLDYAPSVEHTPLESTSNPTPTAANPKPVEFPLFLEGQDATRAAYAMFLLNKDLEQLLNYIGAESLGPRQMLANLKELAKAVQSSRYIT